MELCEWGGFLGGWKWKGDVEGKEFCFGSFVCFWSLVLEVLLFVVGVMVLRLFCGVGVLFV